MSPYNDQSQSADVQGFNPLNLDAIAQAARQRQQQNQKNQQTNQSHGTIGQATGGILGAILGTIAAPGTGTLAGYSAGSALGGAAASLGDKPTGQPQDKAAEAGTALEGADKLSALWEQAKKRATEASFGDSAGAADIATDVAGSIA